MYHRSQRFVGPMMTSTTSRRPVSTGRCAKSGALAPSASNRGPRNPERGDATALRLHPRLRGGPRSLRVRSPRFSRLTRSRSRFRAKKTGNCAWCTPDGMTPRSFSQTRCWSFEQARKGWRGGSYPAGRGGARTASPPRDLLAQVPLLSLRRYVATLIHFWGDYGRSSNDPPFAHVITMYFGRFEPAVFD